MQGWENPTAFACKGWPKINMSNINTSLGLVTMIENSTPLDKEK